MMTHVKSFRKTDRNKEELINDLKSYIENKGIPKSNDFKLSNGLKNINYYKKVLDVSSLQDVLKMAGVEVNDEYVNMHYSENKNKTNEELLKILKEYNDNVEFPTVRAFMSSKGLPSSRTYIDRFGSFKDAILQAGIEIPENKKWLFERSSLTDEEIKVQIKGFIDKYILENNKIPTQDEVDEDKTLPSKSVISRRFGGYSDLLKELGYDLNYNDKILKEQMLKSYVKLAEKLNRTPTSRDLDKYSLIGESYSAKAYGFHFGSIYNIQLKSGWFPVNVGKNKTRQDLLDDMIEISEKYNRIPLQSDFTSSNETASAMRYVKEFGSFYNALIECGFKEDDIFYKRYTTKDGVKCLSSYEYQFALMLEEYNLDFESEPMYKDYIENFDTLHRFDYLVRYKNKEYFIEIFGIEHRDSYKDRAKKKIQICRENNISLICLYPKDFKTKTSEEIYKILFEHIKDIDEKFHNKNHIEFDKINNL